MRLDELKAKIKEKGGYFALNREERQEYKNLKQDGPPAQAPTPVEPMMETPAPQVVDEEPLYDYEKYKGLPQPIQDYLKLTWGNWLDHFEIGQEYKTDFGGYGIYVKVPKEFSTEHYEVTIQKDSNRTRRPEVDKDGNPILSKITYEDIRWKPIRTMDDVKKWLDMVKINIISKAADKGLHLPNVGVALPQGKPTREEYMAKLHQ